MWFLALFAVIGLTAATLWFTVWAERELLASAIAEAPEIDDLAYVLAATTRGPDSNLARAVGRLPWVEDVSTVGGPYDVIIRVREGVRASDALRDLEALPDILRVLPCHATEHATRVQSSNRVETISASSTSERDPVRDDVRSEAPIAAELGLA